MRKRAILTIFARLADIPKRLEISNLKGIPKANGYLTLRRLADRTGIGIKSA